MCDQDNILDPFLVLFGKAGKMGMRNSLIFSPEYLLVMAVAVLVVMGIQP